jgi:hypothetical protein
LDFLGFIRPNPGFSMGYGQKNKKNRTRVSSCVQNVSNDAAPSFSSRAAPADPAIGKGVAYISELRNNLSNHDGPMRRLSIGGAPRHNDRRWRALAAPQIFRPPDGCTSQRDAIGERQ